MKCPHCKKTITVFRNPIQTVDVIIELGNTVVLIERANPPHGWALPGGFVDYGESFEQAARREAREETSLIVEHLHQFRTYSDPSRDERMHTATTVYTATAKGHPVAADDAKSIGLFTLDTLPDLVFDHAKILEDYRLVKTQGLPCLFLSS
jgi:8-oxo-dGTP diphosphatase